jgi:hypothetical protein
MSDITSAQFAEEMLRLAREAPPFRPQAYYDPDGDCIEFVAAPDSFYAERVDDLLTVYYSHDTREIVGSLIKGVKRFLGEHPGLNIDIQDGRVRLVHLLRANFWNKAQPQPIESRTYRKLIAVADESNAEADLLPV